MDAIRCCYRRNCIFYNGQVVPTKIEWFWAEPGASFFDGETVFWSYVKDKETVNTNGPGEVTTSKPHFTNGRRPGS